MAEFISPRIVTDGLVLCLDAANKQSYPGSGNTWNDLSGYAYNGTLTNGPSFNPDNGGNISFDGTDDYVVTTNFNLFPKYTVCCFAKTISTNIQFLITLSSGIGNSSPNDIKSYYFSLQDNKIYFQSGSDSSPVLVSNTNISLNTWFYCVGTFDGSSSKIFINGLYDNTLNPTAFNTPSNPKIFLGRNTYNTSPFNRLFQGNMGLVQIYNRALSPEEVLLNYNSLKGRFGL